MKIKNSLRRSQYYSNVARFCDENKTYDIQVLPEKNTRPKMFIELTYSPPIFQVYKFSGSCPSAFIDGYVSTVRYCWVQA